MYKKYDVLGVIIFLITKLLFDSTSFFKEIITIIK